ncbi:MAG TPA: hypothetical protein PLE77_11185 [Kiritimatiellia bacterium]|nr:hypothetical protein [Kiritimatiellia bacterium]
MTGQLATIPSMLVRRVCLLLVLLALGTILSGCATADREDSDLPWNTPQPWEGSPMIPGLESR